MNSKSVIVTVAVVGGVAVLGVLAYRMFVTWQNNQLIAQARETAATQTQRSQQSIPGQISQYATGVGSLITSLGGLVHLFDFTTPATSSGTAAATTGTIANDGYFSSQADLAYDL